MAACLGLHTVASINQDDRKTCRGSAGRHVAGVLLMPRRVRDDELAARGGEVAVSHVDGDALLSFGAQAVGEQGQIGAIRAALNRGLLDGFELVLKNGLAVVQEATDQRAFAVVDAACRDEAKESLCHCCFAFPCAQK